MLGPAIGGMAAASPATRRRRSGSRASSCSRRACSSGHGSRTCRTPPSATTVEGADGAAAAVEDAGRPTRLRNRLLVAALVLGVGSFFAGGAYEVVWSLYLTSLGASLGMIGLTFFTFALPILVLSPVMGRFIDHEGGFLALVIGIAR